jgi:7-cyano-7-deazaguanine synthase
MEKKALVILSGGQDSTTCLYWAKKHFYEVHAITFSYGQRNDREINASKIVGQMAGVASHEFLEIEQAIKDIGPLTNKTAELNTYQNISEIPKGVKLPTFVPGRNSIFLTIAANRAWNLGIRDLVTGICPGSNPDSTVLFLQTMQATLTAGMGETFEIHAPLKAMSKAEIVKFSSTLEGCWDALAYTHTAYDGLYPPTGNDQASLLRAKGFEEAGLPDPLVVRAWKEGLMALPETSNYNSLR